jgi:hypothetical protein
MLLKENSFEIEGDLGFEFMLKDGRNERRNVERG